MNNKIFLDKVCIIGAAGCIGKFLSERLTSYTTNLVLIDTSHKHSTSHQLTCDLTSTPKATKEKVLADTSVVIFTLPSNTFTELFDSVLESLPKQALIIDTTSAKCKTALFYEAMEKKYNRKLHVLSINPLFKPSAHLNYQPIAYFTKNSFKLHDLLLKIFINSGCTPFESTPEEHDKALSLVQVSTHAWILSFAKRILDCGTPLDVLMKFSTPPFRLLMLLAHRISSGVPEVYWDIQSDNLLAKEARQELNNEANQFSKLVEDQQFSAFKELLNRLDKTLENLSNPTLLSASFSDISKKLESCFNATVNNQDPKEPIDLC